MVLSGLTEVASGGVVPRRGAAPVLLSKRLSTEALSRNSMFDEPSTTRYGYILFGSETSPCHNALSPHTPFRVAAQL